MNSIPQPPPPGELLKLKNKSLTVQELLDRFGARTRISAGTQIEQALAAVGLMTMPDLANCRLKSAVYIVEAGTPAPADSAAAVTSQIPDSDPLKLGDLLVGREGLSSVAPTASLAHAATFMALKGYSQLPVLDGKSVLRGVVTLRSLASLQAKGGPQTLQAAMEIEAVPIAPASDSLFAVLPVVREHGYVLVRDNDGVFRGIVTSADVIDRFEEIAKPFSIIGEIERRLRGCLGNAFDAAVIRSVQMYPPKSGDIADCTFGDYQKLLQPESRWRELGWVNVNHSVFLASMNEVNRIRNKVMHIKPLHAEELLALTQFANQLRHWT